MALALALVLRPPSPPALTTYATATAQLRTIELAEGSQLNLNGETEVSVRFDSRSRVIELARGEIAVRVAHEKRPLRVLADGATITAVGTQFNVDRRENEIVVLVSEGVVEVAGGDLQPVRVPAGNAVRVTAAGIVSAPADSAATAWGEGTVSTSGMSMRDLAHALSRYTEKDIIVSPAIADEVVSGRFSLAQPERTLRLLAGAYDLQLVENESSLILKPAPK
jgi:transmembrane sensor